MQAAANTAASADAAFLTAYFINHRYALFLTDLPTYATAVKS
jgi:hypothetical protein